MLQARAVCRAAQGNAEPNSLRVAHACFGRAAAVQMPAVATAIAVIRALQTRARAIAEACAAAS